MRSHFHHGLSEAVVVPSPRVPVDAVGEAPVDPAEVPPIEVGVVTVPVPPASLKLVMDIVLKSTGPTSKTYLVEPRARALRKIAVAVVVVHVEGGEGHAVVAVQGVAGVAVVQVLVVHPERVPLRT